MTADAAEKLATPRVAAGALFLDTAGRVLLVKPTYKQGWDIPGGYLSPGESPLDACTRELAEELGQAWPVNPQPLVVDWAPAPQEGDKILFVFDGGILPDGAIDDVTFADGEIAELRLVEAGDLDTYLPARLASSGSLSRPVRSDARSMQSMAPSHGTTVPGPHSRRHRKRRTAQLPGPGPVIVLNGLVRRGGEEPPARLTA